MTKAEQKKVNRAKDFLVRALDNQHDSRSKRTLIKDSLALLGYLGETE